MRERGVLVAIFMAGSLFIGCGKTEQGAPPRLQSEPERTNDPAPARGDAADTPSSSSSSSSSPAIVAPAVAQPKPLDGLRGVSANEESKKLDVEVTSFVRGKYSIAGATYYLASGEIPWIAISKSVQNQMAERGIRRETFPWSEPGIDFVDIYPQGDDAFAVAMPRGTKSGAPKLIGHFVLRGSPSAPR